MYYRYRLHKKQKKEVKLLKKATSCGFLMVLRWFAENTKKLKKIVRLDILSNVKSFFCEREKSELCFYLVKLMKIFYAMGRGYSHK